MTLCEPNYKDDSICGARDPNKATGKVLQGRSGRFFMAERGKRPQLSGLSFDSRLTEAEEWQRFARSNRKAAKLMRRIERARAKGNHHAARSLQDLYLRNYHAICGAAREAVRGAKHMGYRLDAACIGATNVMAFRNTADEEIRVRLREKKDGTHRPTCAYGPEGATRQTLARRALEPFADLLPCQFGVTDRGTKDAMTFLKALLEQRRPNGRYRYTHFMLLDVTDFYSSIEADRLGHFLRDKLPQRVISDALTNLYRGNDIRIVPEAPPRETSGRTSLSDRVGLVTDTDTPLSQTCTATLAPLRAVAGLPQGSAASPLVAAIIGASVIRVARLPKNVMLVNIADNFCLIGTTAKSLERAEKSLRLGFCTSPVGQMHLRRDRVGRIVDGFDWVGFRVDRRRGRTALRPAEANVYEFRASASELVCNIRSMVHRRLRREHFARYLQLYVTGWAESLTIREAGMTLSDGYFVAARELAELHLVENHDEVRRTIWDAMRELERRVHRRERGRPLVEQAAAAAHRSAHARSRQCRLNGSNAA